jgi:hypothetical protein
MAESGKYLIGESLREKLKSTISKVDSLSFGGPVSRIPTVFDEGPSSNPRVFRICTFTGSWAINTDKTVTFRGVTSTPNTVSATNVLGTVAEKQAGASMRCTIAKEGTAWYLVSWEPDGGIKRGTFTAPWSKGTTKSVSDAVTAGTTYPNVNNYFANVAGSGTRACAIAYVGTEWILIAAEC